MIDLSKYTVLPGLIDVHTHLTNANNFDPYFELSMTPAKEAIIGVENAKVTLEAGFTTVRNVGANSFTDVALRDEINAGHIPGPHMQVSGPPLGITGGHMDENLLPEEYHVQGQGVADGIPAVQHMVRENIKYGGEEGRNERVPDPRLSRSMELEEFLIINSEPPVTCGWWWHVCGSFVALRV